MLATVQRKRRTKVGTQAAAQRPGKRLAGGSRGVGTELDHALSFETFHTELGWMAIAYHDRVLAQLTFGHATPAAAVEHLAVSPGVEPRRSGWPQLVRRLQAYAAGATDDFADVEIDTSQLAPFERRVVERCRRIPYGQTAQLRAAGPIGRFRPGRSGSGQRHGRQSLSARDPLPPRRPCQRRDRALLGARGQADEAAPAGTRRCAAPGQVRSKGLAAAGLTSRRKPGDSLRRGCAGAFFRRWGPILAPSC